MYATCTCSSRHDDDGQCASALELGPDLLLGVRGVDGRSTPPRQHTDNQQIIARHESCGHTLARLEGNIVYIVGRVLVCMYNVVNLIMATASSGPLGKSTDTRQPTGSPKRQRSNSSLMNCRSRRWVSGVRSEDKGSAMA